MRIGAEDPGDGNRERIGHVVVMPERSGSERFVDLVPDLLRILSERNEEEIVVRQGCVDEVRATLNHKKLKLIRCILGT